MIRRFLLEQILERRWRDLNPRAGYPTYRISSADPSATWVHLQSGETCFTHYIMKIQSVNKKLAQSISRLFYYASK